MKAALPLMAAALLLAMAPAHAQERSAGQSYDAQTNWAALNGKIETVINQNKLLATTIDRMNACNAAEMLYNPASPKADAKGCVNIPSPSKFTSVVQAVGPAHTKTVTVECPADTIRVACFGARRPDMKDTCDEDECGLIGSGPVGARGCRTTIDDGSGTLPTVWATCMKKD